MHACINYIRTYILQSHICTYKHTFGLGYGVNDCEARFWSIPLSEVDGMLYENGILEGGIYKGSGRSVYLYRNASFHEFPDVHTFVSMGFDFDQATLIADARITSKLGAPVLAIY